jgi:hypothetical protein
MYMDMKSAKLYREEAESEEEPLPLEAAEQPQLAPEGNTHPEP